MRRHRLPAILTVLTMIYATLRYNVLKGVPWSDWPSYTLNKAFAVGSLLAIVAAVIRLARRGNGSTTLLVWGGVLALAHSLLTFALLDPIYYPRLFHEGKLTAAASVSLTLGALLIAVMELGARRAANWSPRIRQASLALIAFGTGIHAALPATSTWLNPAAWPGGLPPLTLISFVAGGVSLLVWWLSRRSLQSA